MQSPEILAPAGSMETLHAALRTGADAVYIGGKRFSARNSAANFSEEELSEAASLCHKYGAKLYLAVNTIISDDEAEDFCRYIRFTASIGVDAYIVQDWGCAEIIRKTIPNAVLHGSTQMSVHTAVGASMLSELGWQRIVPARELSKAAIEKICRENIETEIFVHGALCMSVSGQCYMSAVMGSRSANRGCCGQACRLPYSAVNDKKYSALSLKDLSLLPIADELSEIGVDSLKIEGRMKRPEYVASAVSELKKSLSGKTPNMQFLRGVFSRGGFTDSYFQGKRENMFGVREKEDVTAAQSLIPKIHELYRFERSVFPIKIHGMIKCGQPVSVKGECCGISVQISGDVPDTAQNRPTDISAFEKQFSKLGDTVFTLSEITADIDDGLFVPAGRLNELRRELAEKLASAIIRHNTPVYTVSEFLPKLPDVPVQHFDGELPLRTFCRTTEQAETALDYSEYVILDHIIGLSESALEESAVILQNKDKIILSLPRFIDDEDKYISKLAYIRDKFGFSRLFCHTPDSLAIGKKLGMKLHGSFTLNVYNSYSAEYLREFGLEDCVFSFEAALEQIGKIRTSLPIGAAVYGNLPLMLTRNCPIKNEIGCQKCTGSITDRTGRQLPVMCSKSYTEILNPDVLYILDRTNELKNISFGLVFLNNEDRLQTQRALSGRKPDGNITRGLYYRGIF